MTSADLDNLLIAYVHGELPPEQVEQLERRLLTDQPLANRLMTIAAEEAVLVRWARRSSQTRDITEADSVLREVENIRCEAQSPPPLPPKISPAPNVLPPPNVPLPSNVVLPPNVPPTTPSGWPKWTQWPGSGMYFALVIALGAGALGLWSWMGNSSGPPIATVKSLDQARFASENSAVQIGDGFPAGSSLHLKSGTLELAYSNGATLTVRGPSEIQLVDPLHSELKSGQVTAQVPPSAIGYTVATPSISVLDKGTRFGVRVDSTSGTEVHVFDGQVETDAPKGKKGTGSEKQSLLMTQAASFDKSGRLVNWIEPAYAAFGSDRLAPGVVKTSKNVHWVKNLPASLEMGKFASDQDMFLILEKRNVVLAGPMAATFKAPLQGTRSAYKTNRTMLPAGTKCDSYLLHFNPLTTERKAEGEVVFDRPVLAVLARGDHLNYSDKILGAPSITYESQDLSRRGLLGSNDQVPFPDVINFGKAGNSVAIHCPSRKGHIAEVRILVQSE